MNPSFCVGSRNCGGGGKERYRRYIYYISRDDICVLRIPGVYRFPIRTSLNSTVGGLAYLETLGPRGLEESIALLPSTASSSGCLTWVPTEDTNLSRCCAGWPLFPIPRTRLRYKRERVTRKTTSQNGANTIEKNSTRLRQMNVTTLSLDLVRKLFEVGKFPEESFPDQSRYANL